MTLIQVNDRLDPNQPSTPVAGAELMDADGVKRAFLTPVNEFTARLMHAGASAGQRFNIMILGDDVPDGEPLDRWLGVVESWQPQGSKILVTCRPARSAEEGTH